MIRQRIKEFRGQTDDSYEVYEKVHTLNFNALERICELTFKIEKTMAYIRIENINDVRCYKPQKVVYLLNSGYKMDIQFKPPATIEVRKGSILVS